MQLLRPPRLWCTCPHILTRVHPPCTTAGPPSRIHTPDTRMSLEAMRPPSMQPDARSGMLQGLTQSVAIDRVRVPWGLGGTGGPVLC